MSTVFETLSSQEMESLAALLVSELEGKGAAPGRASGEYSDDTLSRDSGNGTSEVTRRQLTAQEAELIRQVVREAGADEAETAFGAGLTQEEQEFLAPFINGPDAFEPFSRKKGRFPMLCRLKKSAPFRRITRRPPARAVSR